MQRYRKLLYSFGSIAAALPQQAFSTYVIFFYVDVLKVPATLISLGMMIYGFWNAINDPLAGQISDRTNTRWGRRIPYILFAAIPLGLAFIMVWTPPFSVAAGQTTLLFAYFLIAIFLYDTLYTIVILNWTSLFPEMFPSLGERAEVSAWRQLFSIVGLMIGVGLPPVLYSTLGWPVMAVIFAVVTVASLGISLLGSHEDPRYRQEQCPAFFAALRHTLANRSFVFYVLANLFIQFAFVMLTGAMPFYTKYVLKISQTQTTLMFTSVFVGALLMLYFWSRLTVRRGARTAMMAAIAAFGLAFLPFWFIRDFTGGLVAAFLLGIGLGGLLILLEVLIADVIDDDETRTGHRREGMYFGVNGFIIRLGVSLQAVVTGLVLNTSGYNAYAAVQPATAVIGIRFLIAGVPLVALVLALISIWLYPLHGAKLAAVKEAIANLNRKGAPM
ncbi:MAG: MFS transporter [Syntrophothermus sp.]